MGCVLSLCYLTSTRILHLHVNNNVSLKVDTEFDYLISLKKHLEGLSRQIKGQHSPWRCINMVCGTVWLPTAFCVPWCLNTGDLGTAHLWGVAHVPCSRGIPQICLVSRPCKVSFFRERFQLDFSVFCRPLIHQRQYMVGDSGMVYLDHLLHALQVDHAWVLHVKVAHV